MKALVLDAEAVNVLAERRDTAATRTVVEALRAAHRTGASVKVPAAVLAELYRNARRNQMVDACLGRHTGICIVDTDRALAKTIGGLLGACGRGSESHVDAAVVAVALAAGGGVVVTGDPDDIRAIGGSQFDVLVTVVPL